MDKKPTRDSTAITDRTQADHGNFLAAIVESSGDAIISMNLDGVILTWNRAAQRMFGYSATEAVGQPITIIIPPELYDEEKDILTRLRGGERIERYVTRRLTRDGRLMDISLIVSPVRNENGKIIGASKILRDITEIKQAQAALLENRRRLEREVTRARTLQSISTRMISESNQETLIELILDGAMELMAAEFASIQVLGQDEESLNLLGWKNFHPDSATFWQRVTAETESPCGVSLHKEERVLVSDVESCEFLAGTQNLQEMRRSGIRAVQSTPLHSRTGRPLGTLSTHWRKPHTPAENDFRLFDVLARQVADLIERIGAEFAVRESEERFRLIANTAPVIIWMANADRQCTYVNHTWRDLTGQSTEAALGGGWTAVMHPDDLEHSLEIRASAIERLEPFQLEYRIQNSDGEIRWIVDRGVPRYNCDGSFAGYIGSAMDVTETRQAEEALATINGRLIDVQEEERSRIARELHDDVSQRLAMLSIRLDMLAQSASTSSEEVRQKAEEACNEVTNLSKDVRDISHRLHPARLDYLGIAEAAAALCQEISDQHRVEISFHADSSPKGLSKRNVVCLYRVLQEALQNAIKHSHVRKIEVQFRCKGDQMELTVCDNGVGFDLKSIRGRGLGLVSMKERLETVKGQLAITSEPIHGTTIQAWVPLQDDSESSSATGRSDLS
jgi:PAS domain S-box-containing protein